MKGLLIDLEQYFVLLDGEKVENMTRREFDLLCFLASNPRIVFTREQQSRNESEVIEPGNYYEVGNGRCVSCHSRQHCYDRYGEVIAASPSLRAWRG